MSGLTESKIHHSLMCLARLIIGAKKESVIISVISDTDECTSVALNLVYELDGKSGNFAWRT